MQMLAFQRDADHMKSKEAALGQSSIHKASMVRISHFVIKSTSSTKIGTGSSCLTRAYATFHSVSNNGWEQK
jgi:hypothetical protein